MEELSHFYDRLREYNLRHFPLSQRWPEWCSIYQKSEPPIYWSLLSKIVGYFPLSSFCLEIGSGLGDVLALLIFLGFRNAKGLERDRALVGAANRKILDLFSIPDCVILGEYPQKFEPCPDLLIQVNCIYPKDIRSKDEYLDQLSLWHTWNGIPSAYIVEVVDSSFSQPHTQYPRFVRLSHHDIQFRFKEFEVKSFPSYKFPLNSSSKCIYCIQPKAK